MVSFTSFSTKGAFYPCMRKLLAYWNLKIAQMNSGHSWNSHINKNTSGPSLSQQKNTVVPQAKKVLRAEPRAPTFLCGQEWLTSSPPSSSWSSLPIFIKCSPGADTALSHSDTPYVADPQIDFRCHVVYSQFIYGTKESWLVNMLHVSWPWFTLGVGQSSVTQHLAVRIRFIPLSWLRGFLGMKTSTHAAWSWWHWIPTTVVVKH